MHPRALTVRLLAGTAAGLLLLAHLHHHVGHDASPSVAVRAPAVSAEQVAVLHLH
jgi:hypothetical protein